MAASSEEFPFAVICSIFQLPRGRPEPFNIKNAIGPINVDTDDKVETLQSLREQIEKLYGQTEKKEMIISQSELRNFSPASEICNCITQYWNSMKALILSIEANPNISILDCFTVEWPSPLNRVSVKVKLTTIATSAHVLGALYMEACLVLFNQVYMLMEDARTTVGTLPNSRSQFKTAADLLCRAAGILDFLAIKIENDWSAHLSGLVSLEQRPLETTPALCTGLKDICLAQAQGMAVAQAIASGKSNSSVLCKLSQGVVTKMSQGLDRLSSIPTYSSISGILKGDNHSPITRHWHFYLAVWKTLANRFAAEVEWSKCVYGNAVAYQLKAVEESKAVGGPFVGELSRISDIVNTWIRQEATTLKNYSDDNSTIYYKAVPPHDSLDPLPTGVVIMKMVPFPETDTIPFSLVKEDFSPPPPPAYSEVVAAASEESTPLEPNPILQQKLESMGFSTDAVRDALQKHNQNEEAALESLLK